MPKETQGEKKRPRSIITNELISACADSQRLISVRSFVSRYLVDNSIPPKIKISFSSFRGILSKERINQIESTTNAANVCYGQ